MYKYQNSISSLKMLSRYKLIFNLLTCLLVFSFILSISGYATTETARIPKNGLNASSMTQKTGLNEAEKVTIEKSRTNFVIPLLFLIFGFVTFIIFTFIFPILGDRKMLDRLK